MEVDNNFLFQQIAEKLLLGVCNNDNKIYFHGKMRKPVSVLTFYSSFRHSQIYRYFAETLYQSFFTIFLTWSSSYFMFFSQPTF